MNRLVAFGDSITFGYALDDNIDTPTVPSIYSWPSVLAKTLQVDLKNCGVPGASNKEIWHNIVNFEYQDNDFVIVNWNTAHRFCFFDNDNTIKIGMSTRYANKKLTDIFYENFYSDTDIKLDNQLRISHCAFFLDSIGIKNYHSFTTGKDFKMKDWMQNITTVGSNMFKFRETDKALDGTHPGKQAQILYAETIHKDLKETM